MANITCHVVTYNCGREAVNVDYFASSLFSSFQSTSLPPDLIVLSLQELAPLGFSFLGGSLLDKYFNNLKDAVARATAWRFEAAAGWKDVFISNLGMTAIMVFARKNVIEQIRWIQAAGTGVGVNEMGNKGAVGIRIGLGKEETVLTFVAAHLAPAEDAWVRRNADWRAICENLVFETQQRVEGQGKSVAAPSEEAEPLLEPSSAKNDPPSSGLFGTPSYIFFAGDLNYRTSDSEPPVGASNTWPQPKSDFSQFLASDQLSRERRANRTLHHLKEAPITFPPTYKYSSKAQKLVAQYIQGSRSQDPGSDTTVSDDELSSLASRYSEDTYIWAKHRTPSWCDRVLYLANAPIEVHSYTSLPIQPTSDHKPVALSFSVPDRPLRENEFVVNAPYELRPDWKQKRAAARRSELVVGFGAYLGFTGQGQTLLVGSVLFLVVGGLLLGYGFGHQ